MKFLVVAACVLLTVQALTDEQREKLKEHSSVCSKSTGVDQETIASAKKGNFSDDEKFKEYLFCLGKRIGFQNEAGELQKDILKQKITLALKDEKLVDEIIEKCAVAQDTPQNTAFEVAKCYYENNAKHSSLV